jgi:hypothetical protein
LLSHNSQGGNGFLGTGWSLAGLSGISRCPQTIAQDGVKGGINYDGNDRYYLDGQRLVMIARVSYGPMAPSTAPGSSPSPGSSPTAQPATVWPTSRPGRSPVISV